MFHLLNNLFHDNNRNYNTYHILKNYMLHELEHINYLLNNLFLKQCKNQFSKQQKL